MSWYTYKEQKPDEIKGLWLRISNPTSNPDLIKFLNDSKLAKRKSLEWVEISDRDKTDPTMVWLHFWCKGLRDIWKGKNRYTVVSMMVKENPEWVVEGDMGRNSNE